MNAKPTGYNDTTDLYLQILWSAQKIEDRKLIAMIKDRLTHQALPIGEESLPCEVIPFPGAYRPPLTGDSGPQLWPSRPQFQVCSLGPTSPFDCTASQTMSRIWSPGSAKLSLPAQSIQALR